LHQLSNVSSVKTYMIVECFYSLQGEGVRAGTPNVFIRFTGCNQTCRVESHGFDCDTEFTSGRKYTLQELYEFVQELSKDCACLVLTGGEPGLQVDREFCDYFKGLGYYLAIETNGSIDLSGLGIDWITVSPKVAEHCIRQRTANEVKYIRNYKQGLPKTVVEAQHYLISPSFSGEVLDQKTLEWCIQLCLENQQWRLSCQQHKGWSLR
jgi:7-carboxy-7-deazaguanine synthase